jgi:hypothetical protein
MTETSLSNSAVSLLTRELRECLIGEELADAVNLRITRHDSRVLVHIMSVSTGRLGMLLATLSDPSELDDPGSLSCRMTPGDRCSRPDQWQYELLIGRYPADNAIVFSAKVQLPVGDLPHVISRLRASTAAPATDPSPPSSPPSTPSSR